MDGSWILINWRLIIEYCSQWYYDNSKTFEDGEHDAEQNIENDTMVNEAKITPKEVIEPTVKILSLILGY